MTWRVIQVTKESKLSLKNKQLLFTPNTSIADAISIPLEDISVIVLDNKEIILSNALIAELAEYSIVLFTTDASHMPSGIFMPFQNHYKYAQGVYTQVEASEPFKKRLWQQVIQAKINNQALVLKYNNNPAYSYLELLVKEVLSGDSKNTEAFAASFYWQNIFPNFKRHEHDMKNAALNYGYAIIRGTIARNIVSTGLLPAFGIHHCNKLNAFNLVDDIMEPFRPFIDNKIFSLNLENNLTTQNKQQLISVLTDNCLINNQEFTILKAMELTAQSLAKCFKEKNITHLQLPTFILT
jgi:CRISPR-associated protein Cas1